MVSAPNSKGIMQSVLSATRTIAFVFQYQAPLSRPEYESDERLRIELIKDEKEALYAGKTLNRLLMHNGEYCFAALNR